MNDKRIAAVIMAGGRGERLRPITDTIPKPNLEVGGKPALGFAASMLSHAGIREATVTVRYKFEDIMDRFGEQYDGVELDYYIEDLPLGTAGSVRAAADEMGKFEELVVLSGDAVCDFDLRPALSHHISSGADATLLLAISNEPWNYGCVKISGGGRQGRITEFIEKPQYTEGRALVNTGIYILSREALDMIPDGEYDFGRELFPEMLRSHRRIEGIAADGYWCDIGTPSAYRRASFEAAKNMIRGVSATVSPTGAIVSDECRVGKGSLLPGCVLFYGVSVGIDVHAEDSIISRGVTIGDGVTICPGTIIGENAFIGSGVTLGNGSVVHAGEDVFHSRTAAEAEPLPIS